jgi:hypothetical protein
MFERRFYERDILWFLIQGAAICKRSPYNRVMLQYYTLRFSKGASKIFTLYVLQFGYEVLFLSILMQPYHLHIYMRPFRSGL